MPAEFNGFAYVYKGKGAVGKDLTPIKEGQAAILTLGGGGNAFDFATTVSEELLRLGEAYGLTDGWVG